MSFHGHPVWIDPISALTSVQVGNDLAQFRDTTHQVIVWPAEYRTGNIIYPYQDAKKK
jgi:hypothetical protein